MAIVPIEYLARNDKGQFLGDGNKLLKVTIKPISIFSAVVIYLYLIVPKKPTIAS